MVRDGVDILKDGEGKDESGSNKQFGRSKVHQVMVEAAAIEVAKICYIVCPWKMRGMAGIEVGSSVT